MESDLANAIRWSGVWDRVENWAFLGVVVFLAIEFAAHRFGAPYRNTVEQARSTEIARLNNETEQLRNKNLELEKQQRGREVTDAQRNQVVTALKGKTVPDRVTYVVHDPEAKMYAVSVVSVLQEVGMRGRVVFMSEGETPDQTGEMFCGAGEQYRDVMEALVSAKMVGIYRLGPFPKELEPAYCPNGSIFIGLRNPLQTLRSPVKKAGAE